VSGITMPLPTGGVAIGRSDRVSLGWKIIGLSWVHASFIGTIERRTPGGVWATLANLGTNADSLDYHDFTPPPGQPMEWRLTWLDLGDALNTSALSAAMTRVDATFYSSDIKPSRVTVRWQVSGDDPDFPMHVLRRELTSDVWETLGLAVREIPGIRIYVDSTVTPTHRYAYRLTWTQGNVTSNSDAQPVFAIGNAIMLGRPSPNPSRAGFSVAFSLPDARPARLELFDVSGRVRFSYSYVGPGAFTFTLPPRTVEPGIYFLRLAGSRGSAIQRVAVAP
jgi:hypothetical protein